MKIRLDFSLCGGYLYKLSALELGEYVLQYQQYLATGHLPAGFLKDHPPFIKEEWEKECQRLRDYSATRSAAGRAKWDKVRAKSQRRKAAKTAPVPDAPEAHPQERDLFAYWQDVMNHPRARLDARLLEKITARLREGFTLDDLKLAVDGNKASPYHQGRNKDRKVYDSLELIVRDAAHVNNFLGVLRAPESSHSPTMSSNIQSAHEAFGI